MANRLAVPARPQLMFAIASLGLGHLHSVAMLAGTCRAGGPEVVNSIGMRLVRIEPGSCVMGQDGPAADYFMTRHPEKCDDADWDERPAHRVTISSAFHLGATEVTIGQYRQFKPEFRRDRGADDEAVTGVSWLAAVKFCEWLSAKEGRTYRLPTEAEWEYACRAGTTTLFHTGDSLPDGFQKWFGKLGRGDRYFTDGKLPRDYHLEKGKTAPRVGQTPANAWGLFDMHGNVAEWCADWYGPYEAGEQTDPLGRKDGDFRVFRGGAHSSFARLTRSANRSAWIPEAVAETIGFRVVLGEWPKGTLLPTPTPPQNAQNVCQGVAKTEKLPADVPFFSGPNAFVKIPPGSAGPLFSWHNHSPAITECPNGDLLAVWYSCVDEGGTELCNAASRLRRGANEWEPASLFWDGPDINDHAPKLWWDGDKTLFHFARGQFENIVRTSTDNGVTWTKARPVQPVCEWGNAPIRTREGHLFITCDATIASVNISRDGGKTWTYPAITDKRDAHRNGSPARHAGIHAPIVQLADGRLMTIGRLNTEAEQAKFNFKTPASYSCDGGVTWTHEPTPFPAISSVQRAVLMRLREGPLLLCSFTDLSANAKKPTGMDFPCDGGTLHGAGLFAALSFDEGETWPHCRLITPGGTPRTVNGIDRGQFTLSPTSAEHNGYLAACQTRDGLIQLISSKNHYVFNLAWLKARPPAHAPTANASASAHLVIASPNEAVAKAVPTVKPASKQNIIVFKEPGRYGGWPANHGIWAWGNEIVVGFAAAYFKHATNGHAVDRGKPSEDWQARSLDGGLTWKTETALPFADSKREPRPAPLTEPMDFTAPDFALMFRFGSLHAGPSWFYVSNDRCHTWRGPFSFAAEGIDRICTRTDLAVLGQRDCMMFGSAAKANGKEGRAFCARTTDGGRHWKLISLIGPEPRAGFAIMPSSLRLPGGALLTTIRNGGGKRHSIDAWRSDDGGLHWTSLGDATPDIGSNPPSLVRLKDGRLCLTYGYRRKPYGARARITSDEGRTWGPEIILRDDGLTGDLGYPRSVVRPDGKVLTVYYFNGPRDEDRAIEATLWEP